MTDRNGRVGLDRRAMLAGLGAGLGMTLANPRPLAAKKDEDDGPGENLTSVHGIEVNARPIAHFERGRPDVKRFGDLEFRGGLVLSSPFVHFGGWSGLITEPDGSGLLAVSDVGGWLSAAIIYDNAQPTGLRRAKLGPLLDGQGKPLERKTEQDAESLTLLEGTLAKGIVLVGFERHHRVVRYPVAGREIGAPVGDMKLAPEAKRMPKNQGLEALAVLKVGFAERFTRGSGYHTGWLWVGGEPKSFQLKDVDGFNITDAVGLPDGDLLVLERYFRWTEGVKMRLRRLAMNEIVPGAKITGRTLLQADSSFEIDNMECIAVHRDAKGDSVVTLMSDDNFNPLLQRTILLQFTLAEKSRNAARP
jgi:hypothetical protein